MNKNGIQYTERSHSWNNGFVDAVMGFGQDKDYIQEMEDRQDVKDYTDGFVMGLDAYDIMNGDY